MKKILIINLIFVLQGCAVIDLFDCADINIRIEEGALDKKGYITNFKVNGAALPSDYPGQLSSLLYNDIYLSGRMELITPGTKDSGEGSDDLKKISAECLKNKGEIIIRGSLFILKDAGAFSGREPGYILTLQFIDPVNLETSGIAELKGCSITEFMENPEAALNKLTERIFEE